MIQHLRLYRMHESSVCFTSFGLASIHEHSIDHLTICNALL